MRFLLPLIVTACLLSSCVSNRKVQYMQKNDVNAENLPKDSVVRTYALDTFQYRIQPHDIINVRFQSLTNKEFDFFNQSTAAGANINNGVGGAQLMGEIVDENGDIPLPVVGKVSVAGLTIFQIQEKLERIAAQYMDSPVVKVRLMNYRITILGEVTSEGTVVLSNNRVSMLEAISHAGMTDLADRKNIKLIRQKGSQTEVIYINLLQEDFFNSPYYYVYQNDVLIIPPLKQRPFRKYFGTNFSLVLSSVSLLLLIINLTR